MKKGISLRPAYLDVLGFKSEDELTHHITCAIQRAIRDQRGEIIPVAVSAAAQAFGIRPDPIMGAMPRDGAIQFDPLEQRFVIRINQSNWPNTSSRAVSNGDECSPELSMYYRSRFTYAHEFAHRFFFVSKDSAWQRAIDIATQGVQSDARRIAIRNLSNYEETLCNRIAGDVLVPETHLVRILGDSLGEIDGLHLALRRASHKFRVSMECLLVRIKRAILHSHLSCPPNLCIFVVTRSDRKGGEARSRRVLRIREAIMPINLFGVKVKGLFPGLAIRNLGQEALSTAEALLASGLGSDPSPVDLKITLATAGGTGLIAPRLTGWASRLYSGGDAQEQVDGLLLWGLLEPA